MDVDIH